MKVDYSTYSFNELADIKRRINPKEFPENYDELENELARRRRSGHLNGAYKKSMKTSNRKIHSESEGELILEFSVVGHKKRRYAFITFFLLVNLILLSIILPKYMVKSLDSVHQYDTFLSGFNCKKTMIEDEETGFVTTYYDLEVVSGEDKFMAFDVGIRMCQLLIQGHKAGDDISVWHDNGVVYQLKSDSRMLLSYRLLKSNIRDVQTHDIFIYWFGVFALWLFLFKSFFNALKPGTFTKD